LAVSVDKNWITAALVNSVYTSNKGGCVGGVQEAFCVRDRDLRADADGIGLDCNAWIADINIVIAGCKIAPDGEA
jgi:hypothetical protein